MQSEYSLLYRDPGEDTIATCRALGVSYVAYSPLGRGLLSATIKRTADIPEDDRRRSHPRFQEANLEHNMALVGRIAEMASMKGCTPSQLALAWVLAQGEDIVPIPGTKHRKYLEENIAAAGIALSAAELDRIDRALPPGVAAGTRYAEPAMQALNR